MRHFDILCVLFLLLIDIARAPDAAAHWDRGTVYENDWWEIRLYLDTVPPGATHMQIRVPAGGVSHPGHEHWRNTGEGRGPLMPVGALGNFPGYEVRDVSHAELAGRECHTVAPFRNIAVDVYFYFPNLAAAGLQHLESFTIDELDRERGRAHAEGEFFARHVSGAFRLGDWETWHEKERLFGDVLFEEEPCPEKEEGRSVPGSSYQSLSAYASRLWARRGDRAPGSKNLPLLAHWLLDRVEEHRHGVSLFAQYGLNSQYAALRLNALAAEVHQALGAGDEHLARLLTEDAVGYAEKLIGFARARDVEAPDAERALQTAREHLEMGQYDRAIARTSQAAAEVLPPLFPEMQTSLPSALYVARVTHGWTGDPVDGVDARFHWADRYHRATTRAGGVAVAVGPPGSYEVLVPVQLSLFGLPLAEYVPQLKDVMAWGRAAGSASERRATTATISIPTSIVPPRAVIILLDNSPSILVILGLLMLALRVARSKLISTRWNRQRRGNGQ